MKRLRLGSSTTLIVLAFAIGTPARAASEESSVLRNWTAPPYWTAPAEAAPPQSREALAAGRQPLNVSPVVMPFVAVAPCRIADTRGFGFTGAYGPPSLAPSETRTYTITGQCGIPSDARAVSFNFTVWNTSSYGNLTVYPAGGAVPTVSTLNWPPGTLALANAAIVQLGSGGSAGQISIANQSSNTIDVFFDVNGYYSPLGVVNTVNGLSGNVSLPSLPPSGAAGGALTGSYPSPSIASGAVGAGNIASGQVVKSVNGLTDALALTAGTNITITPSGNSLTIAGPSGMVGYEMNQQQFNDNFSYGSFAQHIVYCSSSKRIIGAGAWTSSTAYNIQSIQYFHNSGTNQDGVYVTTQSLCDPSLYAGCPGNPITTRVWLTCAN
jgi:hypothetical protein